MRQNFSRWFYFESYNKSSVRRLVRTPPRQGRVLVVRAYIIITLIERLAVHIFQPSVTVVQRSDSGWLSGRSLGWFAGTGNGWCDTRPEQRTAVREKRRTTGLLWFVVSRELVSDKMPYYCILLCSRRHCYYYYYNCCHCRIIMFIRMYNVQLYTRNTQTMLRLP